MCPGWSRSSGVGWFDIFQRKSDDNDDDANDDDANDDDDDDDEDDDVDDDDKNQESDKRRPKLFRRR